MDASAPTPRRANLRRGGMGGTARASWRKLARSEVGASWRKLAQVSWRSFLGGLQAEDGLPIVGLADLRLDELSGEPESAHRRRQLALRVPVRELVLDEEPRKESRARHSLGGMDRHLPKAPESVEHDALGPLLARVPDDAPVRLDRLAEEEVRVVVPAEAHRPIGAPEVRLLKIEDQLARSIRALVAFALRGLGVEIPARSRGVVPGRRARVALARRGVRRGRLGDVRDQ